MNKDYPHKWYWNLCKKENYPLWEPAPDWKKKPFAYSYRDEFTWQHLHFWRSDEWKLVKEILKSKYEEGKIVIPSHEPRIFLRPLIETPFNRVKIVIIGNQPYPKKGFDDGLAFSILPSIKGYKKYPKQLRALLTSYREDTGFPYPRSGSLVDWARRGVLLINNQWTTEENIHWKGHMYLGKKMAWKFLTQEIVQVLREKKEKIVFIFLGKRAQESAYLAKSPKHLVIEAPHPSSYNQMWQEEPFHSHHIFNRATEFLKIDNRIWRLP